MGFDQHLLCDSSRHFSVETDVWDCCSGGLNPQAILVPDVSHMPAWFENPNALNPIPWINHQPEKAGRINYHLSSRLDVIRAVFSGITGLPFFLKFGFQKVSAATLSPSRFRKRPRIRMVKLCRRVLAKFGFPTAWRSDLTNSGLAMSCNKTLNHH